MRALDECYVTVRWPNSGDPLSGFITTLSRSAVIKFRRFFSPALLLLPAMPNILRFVVSRCFSDNVFGLMAVAAVQCQSVSGDISMSRYWGEAATATVFGHYL